MIQVCIDDSRTEPEQGPDFILAGYFATVEQWADFSDDWRAWCRTKPAIQYLKGKHAYRREKEFKGWSLEDRDEKLLGFASLISKHQLTAVKAKINHEKFAENFDFIQIAGRSVLEEPPYTAASAVQAAVLGRILQSGAQDKVQFIFDVNVVTRQELESGYRSIRAKFPPVAVDLIAHEPKFEDDKEFVPLQAADLFAYYIGLEIQLRSRGEELKSPVWTALSAVSCIDASLSDADLRDMSRNVVLSIREWLEKQGRLK
ncbi:MAG: DUF3800 domain-containing protein [Candidatus Binatus sp.]